MIKYKKIGIFVGHSILKNGNCTSADGRKNGGKLEYQVNKELANELKKWFDKVGQPCDVIIVPEKKYNSGYEDDYKLPIANNGQYDLIIEFHLNSFDTKACGAEVLYKSNAGKIVAQRIQDKLKTIWYNRGLKYRDNLYMLTKTKPVAVMIETFFCDNASDCSKYDSIGRVEVAKRIAEGVLDTEIKDNSDYQVGDFKKDVVTTSNLNCRSGRGSEFSILKTFPQGSVANVWYIDKAKDGSLWGSCNSGVKDANGKSITGFIHMGYTKVK